MSPAFDLDTLFAEADYPRRFGQLPFWEALDRFGRRARTRESNRTIPFDKQRTRTNALPLAFARARARNPWFSSIPRYSRRNVCGAQECYRSRVIELKGQIGSERSAGEFMSCVFHRLKRVFDKSKTFYYMD